MKAFLIYMVVALSCIALTNAKKCYICAKLEANGTHLLGDQSCVSSGSKPDDMFVKTCDFNSASAFSMNASPIILPNVTSFIADLQKSANASAVSPRKTEEGCFKVIHEGRMNGANGNYKMTNRGCLRGDPFPDKKCQTKSLTEWAKSSDIWSALVVYVGDAANFQRSAQATACVCTKDKCNSSGRTAGSLILSLVFAGLACSGIFKGFV